jgi:starch synthase
MRYGTVPLVRRTGGLADTVIDVSPATISARTATGFAFDEIAQDGLMFAVNRAMALYKEPLAWRRIQQQGMAQDFGWGTRAAKYAELYREVTGLSDLRSEDLPIRTKRIESIAAE